MATFTNEKLPDLPALLTTLSAEFRVTRDMAASDAATIALLEQVDEPVFNVVDVSKLRVTMEDILQGSNRGGRGESAIWHHPRIRQTIFISDSKIIQLAARGMNSFSFGNLNIPVFPTLEEALVYIRQELSKPPAAGSAGAG